MNGPAIGRDGAALLDRHQEWREADLPTISVLSGTVPLGVQLGRRWAQERGRGVVVVAGDDTRPETLVDAWAHALADSLDLVEDALAWLARRLNQPAHELASALGRTSPFERSTFLATALPEETDVASACRWLLAQPRGDAQPPGLAAGLSAALAACQGVASGERVVGALFGLIHKGGAPCLLLVPPGVEKDQVAWIDSAAASLARLAEFEPQLPIILVITPEALDRYHALAPESRAKALIRGGTVEVPALDGLEIGRRLDEVIPGASTALAAPIRRLAADGASERLVDLFLEAARATAAAAGESKPGHDDMARSAAERFLYERLETLPATAGKFTLNARLDFDFGAGRAIEVDLALPELALAVEIDGYYHFRDADAYRRDRRKDLELQKRGFLVVRVLADDVVRRLEEVLDQILAAVANRRGPNSRGESS